MPASLRILHHPPSFLWEFCCFGFSFAIGSTLSCGVWSVYFLHFSYLDHYLDHWLWGAWWFEWEGLLKAQKFECLVPRWWHCYGKDKEVSVAWLEVCRWRFGVSAAHVRPSLSQRPSPTPCLQHIDRDVNSATVPPCSPPRWPGTHPETVHKPPTKRFPLQFALVSRHSHGKLRQGRNEDGMRPRV